jgi:hypothetical protein
MYIKTLSKQDVKEFFETPKTKDEAKSNTSIMKVMLMIRASKQALLCFAAFIFSLVIDDLATEEEIIKFIRSRKG